MQDLKALVIIISFASEGYSNTHFAVKLVVNIALFQKNRKLKRVKGSKTLSDFNPCQSQIS